MRPRGWVFVLMTTLAACATPQPAAPLVELVVPTLEDAHRPEV